MRGGEGEGEGVRRCRGSLIGQFKGESPPRDHEGGLQLRPFLQKLGLSSAWQGPKVSQMRPLSYNCI